jgi:hypothetical protein
MGSIPILSAIVLRNVREGGMKFFKIKMRHSSMVRAAALYAEGYRFKPCCLNSSSEVLTKEDKKISTCAVTLTPFDGLRANCSA